MKKLTLLVALGLAFVCRTTFAHENDYGDGERSHYTLAYHRSDIGYEVNHVNRMLAHVQREMWRYGAGWNIRREVRHISGEVNRINWEYRNGQSNWFHLRRQIAHVHAELHNVELRLRFRSGDYYRWY